MKTCPSCHTSYPTDFSVCPRDGSGLQDADGWSEGAIVRGKYQILGKVGHGGMATVYRALHTHFQELRALKVISEDLAKDPIFVRRFMQEAIVTRKLQHPNAVRVDDIDQAEDGRPFIVMELIGGRSLKEVIRGEAPLDPARTCKIVKQVASALDAAHNLGIVHRDIKPANIVLLETADGEQAKVLDFGIAKIKEGFLDDNKLSHLTLTGAGKVVGSPAYMSPEQAMGKVGQEIDGRSDLYSLGIVIFQMLTGNLPLKAESDVGYALAHIQTSPDVLHERRPDIPKPIADIVMKCLKKDPEERPASARELIRALDRAVPAPPPPDLDSCRHVVLSILNGESPDQTSPLPKPASEAVKRLEENDRDWLLTQVGDAHFARRNREFVAGGMSTGGMLQALMVLKSGNEEGKEPPTPVPTGLDFDREGVPPITERSSRRPTENRSQGFQSELSEPSVGLATPPPIPPAPNPTFAERAVPEAPRADEMVSAAASPITPVYSLPLPPKRATKRSGLWRLLICVPFLLLGGLWFGYRTLRNPQPHFENAKKLMASHDLSGAMSELQTVIRLKPDFLAAHNALAMALEEKGDIEGSIVEYRQVIRLDPTTATAHGQIGYLLSLKGRNEAAIAEYKNAIALKPQWAEAHYDLAKSLSKVGQQDAAIAEYQKAVGLKPDYADAHHSLGFIYVGEGQYDEAIPELQKAVALKPKDADGHQNLGFSYLKKNRYDDAVGELQKAIAIKPDDANAHLMAGFAYAKNGQLDEAIAEYREALRIKPDLTMADANLKAALKAQKSPSGKKAKKVWDAIHLGDAFRDHAQYDQAIEQYQKALHTDPASAAAKNRLQRARELKASAAH